MELSTTGIYVIVRAKRICLGLQRASYTIYFLIKYMLCIHYSVSPALFLKVTQSLLVPERSAIHVHAQYVRD